MSTEQMVGVHLDAMEEFGVSKVNKGEEARAQVGEVAERDSTQKGKDGDLDAHSVSRLPEGQYLLIMILE